MKTSMVDANGLRFEVSEAGDQNADRLALCLHGFPEHAHSWRFQMPVLAELGYKVWAPNLRGYGGTSRPLRMRDYAVENLLDDVSRLIEASGCHRVTLLGHDWGAAIAWLYASRRPELLERLVIMNVPHPALFEASVRGNFEQMKKSWYVLFFQLPGLPEIMMKRGGSRGMADLFKTSAKNPGNFTAADIEVFAENIRQPGAATAMINYYRAVLLGGGGFRQRRLGYPVIEVPTLMLWGENDVALDKSTTYGTERYVSNLTLRYLPGVSHWVQQDAPETVNQMLRAWLSDQEVPEATSTS